MAKPRTKTNRPNLGNPVVTLASSRRQRPSRRDAAVVATIASLDHTGPGVELPGGSTIVPARSTVPLSAVDVGRAAVVVFEDGDPGRPIVLGVLRQPGQDASPTREVEIDRERLLLTAEREIVLRCGKATITLTRAGKVLLRGAYLLSRSSGVNRIKGGSVQIN